MQPAPLFRSIEPRDLDRVLEINVANVPEVGPLDQQRLRYLVGESALAIAVQLADHLVGFCLVLAPGSDYDSVNYRWFMEHYPDAMYLDRVAIDAAHRGRGLGSLLYAEVDRLMRSNALDAASLTLEVNVEPPNEPSLRFHERLGFGEVGRQMSHGIEVSLMRRPVPSPPAPS
jgi:predicted GNAT superfamily acetyltransferase